MDSTTRRDKYRDFMDGDIQWRDGVPNYDLINELFEQGQTHVWPAGSLEERVQRLVKTYEMELVHKTRPEDFKSINLNKFHSSVNGRKPRTRQEIMELGGGYNYFLQTSLPEELRIFDPSQESLETSNKTFATTFPRGFMLEVLQVYSGPPTIVYKFRHWAFMEGPFKGHAPTGEMIEFYGMAIFHVDAEMKIEKAEFFYDRGELLGGLLRGAGHTTKTPSSTSGSGCPFLKMGIN